jgi:MFS family permease
MLGLGAVLAIGNIGFQMSEGLSGTHIAQLANDFFASAFVVGLILAINPLTNVLVSFPVGILSDRTWWLGGKRRPYLILGTIAACLALAGIPLASAAWQFLLLVAVFQAAHDMVGPAFESLMGDVTTPANRGRVIAVIAFGGYLAQYLIYDRVFQMDRHAAFWSIAIVAMLGILLTVLCIREQRPNAVPAPLTLREIMEGFRVLVTHRPLLWVAGITITMALSVALLNSYFALWSTRQLQLTEADAGGAFAWRSVATMVLLLPVGILTDSIGRKPWVVLGMLLMAAGAVIGWFTEDSDGVFWMGLCYGIGMGFYSPSFQGMMYDAIPRERMGQAIVALMLVRSFSQTILIALCGGVIDLLSDVNAGNDYRIAFMFSFGCAVLSAICAFFAADSRSIGQTPNEIA